MHKNINIDKRAAGRKGARAVLTYKQTSKRPTLKTISDLSGMAVPTVSRALNDAPDIGQKTKDKVQRIAREIGYVPNRAGVRLKTGKTNVISLILSTEHEVMNHTARLISSVAGSLKKTRYHLNITPYFPAEGLMAPIRYVVETNSADAVIINQTEAQDPRVQYMLERGFPFATHGRTNWRDQHPYFDFNNHEFARLAIDRLVAAGRRKILLINPPDHHLYAQHIAAGAKDAGAQAGIELITMADATSDSPLPVIRAATTAALAKDPQLDGMICASTTAAMAGVTALEQTGRVLGRDFDVVGKEGVPFLTLFRPAMLAVTEDVIKAGDFLARAAIQAVEAPDKPPLQHVDVPTPADFSKPDPNT